MQTIKLGFIVDNIRSSSAPKVHHMAAAQIGIDLSYEFIVPGEKGFDFDWAFDAVYQPVETPFKQLIEARRIPFISGFELFFHQGVDAFSIFTGFDVTDKMALRDVLFRTLCCKGSS